MAAGAQVLRPDWPAPAGIHAFTTLRHDGASATPYGQWNLADHVGDVPADVAANRHRLRVEYELPAEPSWLRQVHGRGVVDAARVQLETEADGSFSNQAGVVCAVLTADCLPVLLCSRDGRRVAAAHAGWRGLAEGVLEATVAAMGGGALIAWLGPAIGPANFEVGSEVRAAFVERDPVAAEAFQDSRPGHWHADLYALARLRLASCGVDAVYGGGLCAFADAERFYSFRRDGVTGRMASVIWREG